jgi:hypothetical protein
MPTNHGGGGSRFGSAFGATLSSSCGIFSRIPSSVQSIGRLSSRTMKLSVVQSARYASIGMSPSSSPPSSFSSFASSSRGWVSVSPGGGVGGVSGYSGIVVKYATSVRCCGGSVTVRKAVPGPARTSFALALPCAGTTLRFSVAMSRTTRSSARMIQ